MWDLLVSIPDHCLSFYFSRDQLFLQVRIEWFLLSTHIFQTKQFKCSQKLKSKTYLFVDFFKYFFM